MATKKIRKSKVSRKRWNYFYLNDCLHKTLEVNRAENTLVAWNFKENKRVAYVLSDAYSRRQRAYSIIQVSRLIGKHVDTLKRHLRNEDLRKPQAAYSLDGTHKLIRYMFSENDIREIHAFFKTVHIGRPRHDKKINTGDLLSGPELEALLRNEKVLYTKDADGEFVPVWKQPEW